MKIKEEFIQEIVNSSSKIDEAIKRLGVVTYNQTLVKKQKDNLLVLIQSLNTQKEDLIKKISNEYGEGYIDPNTWEFYTKHEQVDVKKD